MSKTMTLKPAMSEKSFGLSQDTRTYIFVVPAGVNRLAVSAAVTEQFDVGVDSVRIANLGGKSKRTIQSGHSVRGKRQGRKKAYVTLKEGDSLPFFAEEEKAKEDSKKAEDKTEPEKAKPAGQPVEEEVKKKRGLRQAFSRIPRQTQNRGGEK